MLVVYLSDSIIELLTRHAQALTGEHGISVDRVTGGGVGPLAPLASNSTEEGQALNRRVELVEN